MSKYKQINIRIDAGLYETAKWKADKLGLPLSTLIRVFIKAMCTQRGAGFYIGDQDLAHLFNQWMDKKQFEKARGGRAADPGLRLKDIFELSSKK